MAGAAQQAAPKRVTSVEGITDIEHVAIENRLADKRKTEQLQRGLLN